MKTYLALAAMVASLAYSCVSEARCYERPLEQGSGTVKICEAVRR